MTFLYRSESRQVVLSFFLLVNLVLQSVEKSEQKNVMNHNKLFQTNISLLKLRVHLK